MRNILFTNLLILIFIAGLPTVCPASDPTDPPVRGYALGSGAARGESDPAVAMADPLRVEIKQQGRAFRLFRGNAPYYIKGIGGRHFIETAAAAGANSIRTWNHRNAGALLDRAQDLQMTVMLGVWLSHHASDYADPHYRASKIKEVRDLVKRCKRHPALLMWSLGNEINLAGGDTRKAWLFVDELARLIKELDPNHPVISVIAFKQTTLNAIAALAPHLDAVGINAYGALTSLRTAVDRSRYKGPYIITEWGVDGHWEVLHTSWGRPIEPTSARKEEYHLERYNHDILANSDRCIGSYVFLWGQKQERTPTWYSMFLKNSPGADTGPVSLPAVDAMRFNWTGAWPQNRAPQVWNMVLNDGSAENNIILSPDEPMVSRVKAGDPENDPLSYVWELLEEPTALGTGGSHEARPRTLACVREDAPVLNLRAPSTPGQYRLFVYVLDHNGHAGTANVPFRVAGPPYQKIMAERHSAEPGG
jgi:Glycosyl hydrolases family 2, TIM barrel domain